jgi:hypothetical protein
MAFINQSLKGGLMAFNAAARSRLNEEEGGEGADKWTPRCSEREREG